MGKERRTIFKRKEKEEAVVTQLPLCDYARLFIEVFFYKLFASFDFTLADAIYGTVH